MLSKLNNKFNLILILTILIFTFFLINLVSEQKKTSKSSIEENHYYNLFLAKNNDFSDPSFLFFPIDEYHRVFRNMNINLKQKIWLKEIFLKNYEKIVYKKKNSHINLSTKNQKEDNKRKTNPSIPEKKIYSSLNLNPIKQKVLKLKFDINKLKNYSKVSFIQLHNIQFAYILNSCGINQLDKILLKFVKYQLNLGKKFKQDVIVDWHAITKQTF